MVDRFAGFHTCGMNQNLWRDIWLEDTGGDSQFFTAISPIYLRFARVIELVWVIHSLPGLWKKIGGSSAHLYSHGTNPDVWIILKQSNPNKLPRYPQQPQSFISKNLSEACCQAKRWDLLLTWLCTKASRSLFRNLLRNPVKPKLALHQSLPHPEPRWTWPGGLWCRAKSGSTGFPRRLRFQEALAQSQVRSNRVPEKVPEKASEKVGETSQVRFNRVPEKVPEKVWEALVQSQVKFNRVPGKVPVKVWEALVQSQVRFNRVPEKVPEKIWEALVQSQVRFNRVPEKLPEKVWEASVQCQVSSTGFRRRSGSLWCRAGSGSTGFRRRFRRRFQEALVQSPGSTRFREGCGEGSGQGSGEGLGGFGGEPGQVQQGSREGPGEGFRQRHTGAILGWRPHRLLRCWGEKNRRDSTTDQGS